MVCVIICVIISKLRFVQHSVVELTYIFKNVLGYLKKKTVVVITRSTRFCVRVSSQDTQKLKKNFGYVFLFVFCFVFLVSGLYR